MASRRWAQVAHITDAAFGAIRLATTPPEIPARRIHDARKSGIESSRFIDELLGSSASWAKTEPIKHATNMHVRRQVDGVVV
jgi:hypothetical protein